MGELLGSLVWGAKSGQYCVIGGVSLQLVLYISEASMVSEIPKKKTEEKESLRWKSW
jgi:hypothetical protein